MVRCRVAALTKALDFSESIRSVSVLAFTSPRVTVHRIRRPQVVHVGGHRESEDGIPAWLRQFDPKPPEVVGDDINIGTGAAVKQNVGVRVHVAPARFYIQIVSPFITVPRSDRLDSTGACAHNPNAIFADEVLRAVFALAAISPLVAAWGHFAVGAGVTGWTLDAFVVFDAIHFGRAEELIVALSRDFAYCPSIPEAEGVVLGCLGESKCLVASMVFVRVAALAASEFAVVISVVFVIRRAGPTFAIRGISCSQMVQIGSKLEIELGILAWLCELYSKVPEIVGDDLDASTTATVTKQHGIRAKTGEAPRQINVVVLLAGGPGLDTFDAVFGIAGVSAYTITDGAFRTRLAFILPVGPHSLFALDAAVATRVGRAFRACVAIAVSVHSGLYRFALAFHRELGNQSGVTEAESVVLGFLGETDRLSPPMVRRRFSPFAASESTPGVAAIKVV